MATRAFRIAGVDSAGNPLTVEGSIIDGGTPAPEPAPAAHEITLTAAGFTPRELTVKPGAVVAWINKTAQPAQVSTDGHEFDSLTIIPGGQFKRAFPTVGTFRFFNRYVANPGQTGPWNGQLVVAGDSEPAPGAPRLDTLTVSPAQVLSGQPAQVSATVKPAGSSDLLLSLSYQGPVTGPAVLRVPALRNSVTVPVQTAPGQVGPGLITATDGVNTRTASLSIALPGPAPGNRINVRDQGIRADGSDETAALQQILSAAPPGAEIYFPAGNYLASGLGLLKSGQAVTGDGEGSRLIHGTRQGFHVGGAGLNVADVAIRKLCMVGSPGKFNAQGNGVAHAILDDGSRNVTVEDVLFLGPGHAVYQVNQAKGLTIRRCRVTGYGRVCFGLGDGATVEDSDVQQNYPDPTQRGLDYIYYIHNSAKDVVIKNCKGSGAGGYAVHYWAQADVGPGGPITITDCDFTDNVIGMIIANGEARVGRVQGLTVQRNQFVGVVRGSCVVIRQGDGVLFEGNTIKSGKPAVDVEMSNSQGLAIGQWGPGDVGGSLTNAVFRNNVIDGWHFGLYALASNGGKFVGCRIEGNSITDCRRPLIAEPSAGLTVVS